jgi:transcriptional regulator with XRE-family HTH domain
MPKKPTGDARMGARIKSGREAKGLTQAGLGRRIDKEQPSISQFETGQVMPEPETLDAIADVLGVSLDYLRGRTVMALEYEGFEQALLNALPRAQKRRLVSLDQAERDALAAELADYLGSRLDRLQVSRHKHTHNAKTPSSGPRLRR